MNSVDIPVRKPRRHKLHTKHAKEQSKKKEIYDKQAAINAVELKRENAIREKGRKLNISCTRILNLYNKKYKNLKLKNKKLKLFNQKLLNKVFKFLNF